jgi:hypothetical protein
MSATASIRYMVRLSSDTAEHFPAVSVICDCGPVTWVFSGKEFPLVSVSKELFGKCLFDHFYCGINP